MRTNSPKPQKSTFSALASSLNHVGRDMYQGFIHTTQNGLALLGTVAALTLLVFGMRADLRTTAEERLLSWLLERQEAQQLVERDVEVEPSAIERVTAGSLRDLTEQQAKVTQWLSKRYRVAPEPLAALVSEAYNIGERVRIDPTLLLAVMAIESRFNPYAQSPVGAQGLMQVLTRVHTEKYEDFGGELAALDPLSNLRVGAKVLQDAIRRSGSVEGGLRLYVGAVSTDGSWYINRVLAERLRIQSVAQGKPMQRYVPPAQAIPVTAPPVQGDVEAEVRPGHTTTAMPS
ncbi:MAG: transglycosylase SLT domain-containing protein [Hydrogenophaga sp.]|uniref:transglycosylase SLT domain-containing protein n=1 Tax=Hydrogenophaga sp. TaxID=1904254 RepID=UPI001DB674D5|nr:transglycosylase SLT domain-containing protein [Hydrogenophaga sp.]MBX3610610.1 transglycosylase SLT domain-containing protein [Hydrogenophaga sp.]